jgi:hypothetical protein
MACILVWMIALIKASIQGRTCRPAHQKTRQSDAVTTAGCASATWHVVGSQQPKRSRRTKRRLRIGSCSLTLRSRTRARDTWTNARALKPAGYTKTTWDRHPASFLNAPRRGGVGDQGETNQHNKQSRRGQGGQGKTSAMDNVDHPWKARCIWVLLGVGEAGGPPCVGAALLQTKACKQRSVGG